MRARKLLPVPLCAEDAGRPLDEPVQLEADGQVHRQRRTDREVHAFFLAEYRAEVHLVGFTQGGEVHGYRAYRLGAFRIVQEIELVRLAHHQHGLDLHGGVGAGPGQGVHDERRSPSRRIGQQGGVGSPQLHIGDHAEVGIFRSLDDDELADT